MDEAQHGLGLLPMKMMAYVGEPHVRAVRRPSHSAAASSLINITQFRIPLQQKNWTTNAIEQRLPIVTAQPLATHDRRENLRVSL